MVILCLPNKRSYLQGINNAQWHNKQLEKNHYHHLSLLHHEMYKVLCWKKFTRIKGNTTVKISAWQQRSGNSSCKVSQEWPTVNPFVLLWHKGINWKILWFEEIVSAKFMLVACRAEKKKVWLPGAGKFCSWPSENRSSVAQWASEIRLSSLAILNENISLINDNCQSDKTERLVMHYHQIESIWISFRILHLSSDFYTSCHIGK